jgi:aminomuconate-semialdehyde/2-hydroxymuconate-6-semialdehyde dehydrogenase
MTVLKSFAEGQFTDSGGGLFDKVSPVDGTRVAQVEEASEVVVDHAVRAARAAFDGTWGRTSAVWTTDLERGHRVAGAPDIGMAWVNTWYLRDLRSPFGGNGRSGIGREGGRHSLDFYTRPANVCVAL